MLVGSASRLVVAIGLAAGLLQVRQGFAQDQQSQDQQSYEGTSFFFAAHEDDWQLFMNPTAFLDVANGKTKAVFVHVTAGDAGLGMGTAGRKHPFYRARENGAEAAIRFMADRDGPPAERTASHVRLNGHRIYRVTYRNTVSYFLRVADGNPKGSGYEATGYQSLSRLASGESKILAAIDGSTVYHGWPDLVATMHAIVDRERGACISVSLHVSETNPSINPDDHADHQMTTKAALDATKDLTCARRLYYTNYASARLPENVSSNLRDMESAVFAVTAAGIRAFDHSSAWQRYNQAYIGRNYFRVEEGKGRCETAVPKQENAMRVVGARRRTREHAQRGDSGL
jgi:LmbE family N-acetylglucosaminyl deacetylase